MAARKKGYGQFCPVAKGAEVFAERWTPLVLRELLKGGRRFNDLRRGVPKMSQSLLSRRLKELEQAGILERRPAPGHAGWEYHLTPSGEDLRPVVEHLGVWAYRWFQTEISQEDLDAGMLLLDMHRTLASRPLPSRRTVLQLVLPDAGPGLVRWWLVLEPPEPDLCQTDPGFPVDLTLTCSLLTLTRIWMGKLTFDGARRLGELELDGPPALARRLPDLIGMSNYGGLARTNT